MAMEESKVTKMKKFIFEEKFISYADVEIYAENEEDASIGSFKMETTVSMMYLISQMDTNLSMLERRQTTL